MGTSWTPPLLGGGLWISQEGRRPLRGAPCVSAPLQRGGRGSNVRDIYSVSLLSRGWPPSGARPSGLCGRAGCGARGADQRCSINCYHNHQTCPNRAGARTEAWREEWRSRWRLLARRVQRGGRRAGVATRHRKRLFAARAIAHRAIRRAHGNRVQNQEEC